MLKLICYFILKPTTCLHRRSTHLIHQSNPYCYLAKILHFNKVSLTIIPIIFHRKRAGIYFHLKHYLPAASYAGLAISKEVGISGRRIF